ncbi:bone marrow stromal antigen 2 [Lemur catta]|uniref:bone marrow stromal antigen 2 n=1 Tax=Lemur catta TaxID=9447 RepID=UPI001E267A00|nr:bone marrow stromal antigen 2 [Lemur catta]
MAPTFYHYSPVAMDDICKEERGQGLWHRKVPLPQVACLLLTVLLLLGVPVVIFAMEANSEHCKDGLRAEMKCRNVTHLLECQLAQAQEGFLEAEARATICNHTVVTLEVEKNHALNQTKELEGEISKLNLKLQDASAEVERLKKENKDLRSRTWHNHEPDSSSPLAATSSTVPRALLLLGLGLCALLL